MLKRVFYIVIAVLVLQVVKVVLIRLTYRHANFAGILIMALQFYIVLFPIVYYLIRKAVFFIKSGFTRTLVSVMASFAVFVSVELLMNYYLYHADKAPRFLQDPIWLFYEKYDFNIIQYTKNQAVYDDKLFYKLKPNSRSVFYNREFTDSIFVNSKGLRDDEASLQKPAIICLGDSYFMGWGIKQDSTFSELLQAKSGKKVLNAAISSYGTAREMEMLKQLDTSNLQYLVIQYCVNDWIENKYYLSHNHQLKISSREQYEAEQFEHRLSRSYFPGRFSSMIGHLLMKFSINKIRPVFNLPYDRITTVNSEMEQARDFLEILSLNQGLFGNAGLIITLMDSGKRVDNKFLREVELQLKQEKYAELAHRIKIIHTEKLFQPEDFYFLDQHAKTSAYVKLSDIVMDSIRNHHP